MSKFRCFDTYNLTNFCSSEYTKRKRRNTIFNESQTIAIGNSSFQNAIQSNSIPPGYIKKSNGSLYYGPVFVSTKTSDLNNCLISTKNYELLYDVLFGATPSPADINQNNVNLTNSSWEGNISKISFTPINNCGPALSTIPDTSFDMIDYIPRQDLPPTYNDIDGNPSFRYPGIVIDPCYNIFYNNCTSTSQPNNFMQNVTYNFNEQKLFNPDLIKYISKTTSNSYTRFPYPLNFQETTCEKFQFTFIISFTNTKNVNIDYILENYLPVCNTENSIIFNKPIVNKGLNNTVTILLQFKYTGKQSTIDGFTFCPYQVFNFKNLSYNQNYYNPELLINNKNINLNLVNFYNETEAPVIIEQFNNIPFAQNGYHFFNLNHVIINANDKPIIKPNTSFENTFKNVKNINITSQNTINEWDTRNVINMKSMFENTNFNYNIDKWNTTNVNNMSYMFADSSFNQSLNNWNTNNVTNMSGMFYNAKQFNGDITNWKTDNVKNMNYMFSGASMFDKNIKYDENNKSWNTINVEYMDDIFLNASIFNTKYNITSLGWKINDKLKINMQN